MLHHQSRREFLKQTAQLLAAASSVPLAAGSVFAKGKEPLFQISLAQWSFHQTLFGGKMNHLDFTRVAKRDYGIEGVEYVNQFFKDKARDQSYLAEMKKIADGEGVKSVLIMCDSEGYLGDPDEKKRTEAVENHYKWVEAAKFLGCHSIRVNARSSGSYDEQMKLAADGLHRLSEFGAAHDMNVIVENHGGLSSNGAWLAATIKMANHPRCGTLPDFGNFNLGDGKTYDRYKGVEEMMPYAKGVSAKSNDFDEKGNEIHTDYRRMLKLVLAAGYRGFIGIEYEGKKLSEADGVRATKKLLETIRTEMQSEVDSTATTAPASSCDSCSSNSEQPINRPRFRKLRRLLDR